MNQENQNNFYIDEVNETDYKIKISLLLRYWYWIALSLVFFLTGAYLYLRYTTKTYESTSKIKILDKNEGALAKILSIIKKGIGAPIASGKQYMPWIHIEDTVDLFIYCLMNENLNGVYNGVAEQHVNNKELTKSLASANKKKIWLPNVPAFIMKGIYGELADILPKQDRHKSIVKGMMGKVK